MGSSFSIVNDTDEPIWVSVGVCHAALWGTIGGVVAVATVGTAAGIVAGGAAAAAGSAIVAAVATAKSGLAALLPTSVVAALTTTEAAQVATVSGLLYYSAGNISKLSRRDEQKVLQAQKELKEKLKSYRRIKPGGKHRVDGTLSLVKTVRVVFDDGRQAKKDCWTGATDGSEKLYPVSEYF